MKIGTENKKQLYTVGVLGFVAILCLYPLYNTLFGGPPSTPAPAAPVLIAAPLAPRVTTAPNGAPSKTITTPPGFIVGGNAAEKVGAGGQALDPTLHMEAMHVTESLVYSGMGRNIFAGGPTPLELAAVAAPKPIAPARPVVAALPPPPPLPTGPPPPPPINLKFFGTATAANGSRKAFLLNGDDVFLASPGDVVQRRYRVVTIAANSIVVEDIPNSNKQTLPLVLN